MNKVLLPSLTVARARDGPPRLPHPNDYADRSARNRLIDCYLLNRSERTFHADASLLPPAC